MTAAGIRVFFGCVKNREVRGSLHLSVAVARAAGAAGFGNAPMSSVSGGRRRTDDPGVTPGRFSSEDGEEELTSFRVRGTLSCGLEPGEVEMPKMKTNRATAKRIRRTGSGKLRRRRSNKSHILTKKTRKRKRRLRQPTLVSPADRKRVERLLPGT